MLPPTVGIGTLRRLAAIDFGGPPVVSMYVDLTACNGAAAAAARELDALVRKVALGLHNGSAEAIRKSLRSIPPLAWGTHGLAVFSGPDGWPFEMVPLPVPVRTQAVIDIAPWLEPLAEMMAFPPASNGHRLAL